MGCISFANFVFLTIGVPSCFFKASQGLRQGCALSALLFLFVIKGMSKLIFATHFI